MSSVGGVTETPTAARVQALLNIAQEVQDGGIESDARALLERLREGRFYVACLGQFKRGKSTVVNALLGEALLPTGTAPVTSVVTIIRHGARRARVRLVGGEWLEIQVADLPQYVSESGNPGNAKGVAAVEVFSENGLLADGLCLVDTPGIGSVILHNTAETRSFLPQIDVGLVVLGGDPPISGEELDLVNEIAKEVRDLVFILNKADRLRDAELAEARAFTVSVLSPRVPPPLRLFEVSALERVQGGETRDWSRLVEALRQMADASGKLLVAQAGARGASILASRLRRRLTEDRDALRRPIEESERRLQTLRACAQNAEQSLADLGPLLGAEQQRLARRFEADRQRFVEAATPRVVELLEASLKVSAPLRGPRLWRYALDQAQDVAERLVREWLETEQPVAEREFADAAERFVAHANGVLAALRSSGAVPADALPSALDSETGFRVRSHYHFEWLMRLTSGTSWAWLADWLRSGDALRRRARATAVEFALRLLDVNSHRVVGDLNDRVVESRRSVEAALRRTIEDAVGLAADAARRASELRARGIAAVEGEMGAIEARLSRLERLAEEPVS